LSNFPAILCKKEDFARYFSRIDACIGVWKNILIFFILGEIVTVMQISGMVLLFVGVCFLSKKEEAYF